MSAIKIISFIVAAILIFFGILFVWGAFSPQGSPGWIIVGVISIAIGFMIIWFASHQKVSPTAADQNVTLKIDLPANVNLESMKCKSCGGTLTTENIEMVAGAPVVHCPYCKSSYQLTEDPKW